MDIEVGEWVRTIKGTIDRFKYKTIYDNGADKYVFETTSMSNPEYYIIKHSKNIIDLIEVGDFVNGKKVVKIRQGGWGIQLILLGKNEIIMSNKKSIKTILTHEQYERNAYILEE